MGFGGITTHSRHPELLQYQQTVRLSHGRNMREAALQGVLRGTRYSLMEKLFFYLHNLFPRSFPPFSELLNPSLGSTQLAYVQMKIQQTITS